MRINFSTIFIYHYHRNCKEIFKLSRRKKQCVIIVREEQIETQVIVSFEKLRNLSGVCVCVSPTSVHGKQKYNRGLSLLYDKTTLKEINKIKRLYINLRNVMQRLRAQNG